MTLPTSSFRRLAAGVTLGLLAPLLLALLPSSGHAAPAPAAAACSLTSTGGTVTKNVWVGAELRSYNLRVPTGLTGNTPLLLDLHGVGSNAFFQETSSGWRARADAKKFIAAWPAGSSWGQAWDINQGSSDVTFIRAVVSQIKSTYCVDAKRVFATGGSLGGHMSQRLACDAEDVFASIAPVITGPLDAFGCTVSRPVSVAAFSSEDDPLFPADPNGKNLKDLWVGKNHCSTTSVSDPNPYGVFGEIHNGCDGGAQVLFRSYGGNLGHAYPTGAALTDLTTKAWSLLQAHPMP